MDIFGTFIIYILAVMSIAHANPDEADTHPHIVQIDVTDIFPFNLIRNTNGHLTPGNVQTIMQRIFLLKIVT